MSRFQFIFAFVFVSFGLLGAASGANILFLNGVASPSHHIFNRALVLGLAAKGHNVTFLSADVSKETKPDVHYIHLEKVYDALYQGPETLDLLAYAELSAWQQLLGYAMLAEMTCGGILESEGLETLLNYPNDFKFDAIIHDVTFGPCLLPLIARFNYPPMITETAFANPPFTTDYVGGHKYPAYVPHYDLNYPQHMNFFQRLYNTVIQVLDWLSREFIMNAKGEELARKRFKFPFPSFKELAERTALILVNTDDAIDTPEPIQPNMIQVGGLQIVDPKPLPKEMEEFIAKGKKGTVLMSLGTNMKSNLLGNDRLKVILDTFAALPEYNFLWKFESEAKDLPVAPSKNVMLGKFLPQNDILAHPNIIAFVSHSGMLSTHEAFWHGTPLISMPFFVDQHMNSGKAINLGVGVKVDFKDLSVKSFKSSIESVVKDPKYSERAKKVSKLFRDKPQRPLDTAVWWIEYAIRNPNLDHLKSPTLKLGVLAAYSYDIFIVFLIFLYLVLFAVCKIIKFFKKLLGFQKSKSKTE